MPGLQPLPNDFPAVAFMGLGEAAQALCSGWGARAPSDLRGYDLKLLDAAQAVAMIEQGTGLGIVCEADPAAALAGAGMVFCLVTADQAVAAAQAAAPHLRSGALWLDGNSCAPQSKEEAARLIEAAGGRYVDMAIMAPVHPKRHHVPILLAGPHAQVAHDRLVELDMRPTVAGPKIGDASTIKMLRSVMIKGFEALTAECFLAARRAGVEEAVIASLQASDPGFDWRARGAYNLERMMVHGTRRAAEMGEVARTVADLGLPSAMSQAIVTWQAALGGLGLEGGSEDLADRADRVLAQL